MFCKSCGNRLGPNDTVCAHCGSERIHHWNLSTCPKCNGHMVYTGEKEFWT